jgi:hypothetical protein
VNENGEGSDYRRYEALRCCVLQSDGTSRMSREAHVRICGGRAGETPAGYPAELMAVAGEKVMAIYRMPVRSSVRMLADEPADYL